MAYIQYNDYYKHMLLSGRIPIPYPNRSPYVHVAPNLCNSNCDQGQIDVITGSWPVEQYYPWNLQYNSYFTGEDLCADPCGEYSYPYQDPSVGRNFVKVCLVSNVQSCGRNTDPDLCDPWGIIFINDIMWVSNARSGLITKYNLLGMPVSAPINVFGPCCNIAQPTGIVHNCNPNAFPLIKGPVCEISSIIVATRDGTINGYNCDIDSTNSAILIDRSGCNCVYTGLEIFADILYAVDFYNQCIDVFDSSCCKIMPGAFLDECIIDPIPCDFSPYNIVRIIDVFYVTYARQNPLDSQYELLGVGNGYINIFSLDGVFIRRFCSRECLNTPWGITLAPSCFGYPAGSICVSNFGDNTVGVYGPDGNYIGKITDGNGNNICIPGIRGLCTNSNQNNNMVYWTSRSDNLNKAYVGTLDPMRRII